MYTKKRIKDMLFIELDNDNLKRELFLVMNKADKNVSLNSILIRNTLDKYRDDPMFVTDGKYHKDLHYNTLDFLKKHKYDLGLDITKNVVVVIKYTRHMEHNYIVEYII
jgi:hypothetical protein